MSALLTAQVTVNAAFWWVETMGPSGSLFLPRVIAGQRNMCLLCSAFSLVVFFLSLPFFVVLPASAVELAPSWAE